MKWRLKKKMEEINKLLTAMKMIDKECLTCGSHNTEIIGKDKYCWNCGGYFIK